MTNICKDILHCISNCILPCTFLCSQNHWKSFASAPEATQTIQKCFEVFDLEGRKVSSPSRKSEMFKVFVSHMARNSSGADEE